MDSAGMIDAIILAGGFGTRLQSVVSEVPKCLAPVAGQPFLHYLMRQLRKAGFRRVTLSLGYLHEQVEDWLRRSPTALDVTTVVEHEPLGTGGGVSLALKQTLSQSVFVLNGDTYLDVDFEQMWQAHTAHSGTLATIALKEMHDFDRYGVVDCDATGRITGFREKRHTDHGHINGGVYLLDRHAFDMMPNQFSIERDFFEPNVTRGLLRGFYTDGYFIDIGIPDDYARAQKDFQDGQAF